MNASKGFRRITVDGVAYHWLVREDDRGDLELHVHSKERRGQVLSVNFDSEQALPGEDWGFPRPPGLRFYSVNTGEGLYRCWNHERGFFSIPLAVISPRVVASTIRAALAAGWQPTTGGDRWNLHLGAPSTLC